MALLSIGLTGGVASGKSLAAAHFERLGVAVLDADLVAREVVRPGTPALAEIAQVFDPEYLLADGELDRRRLRAHVFAAPAALRQLEAITHPAIRAELARWRDAQAGPYCILSVAILVEAGMKDLVDRVLVIDVPAPTQLARLTRRDGITQQLAEQMLAAQADRPARLAAADDVIVNEGALPDLEAAVHELHAYYLQLAASGDFRAPPRRFPPSV